MGWFKKLKKKAKKLRKKLKKLKLKDVVSSNIVKGALSFVPGGSIITKGMDVVSGWTEKAKPFLSQVGDKVKKFGSDVYEGAIEGGSKEIKKQFSPASSRGTGWSNMNIGRNTMGATAQKNKSPGKMSK